MNNIDPSQHKKQLYGKERERKEIEMTVGVHTCLDYIFYRNSGILGHETQDRKYYKSWQDTCEYTKAYK